MSDTYRVAVAGGGIVGVATAWHLAARGLTDVVLLERAELTSGSTWHAAGNLPHFSGSFNVMKLHAASKRLYGELRERHGDVGLHVTGSIRFAHTPDRMDEYARVAAMGRQIGLDLRLMTPDEMRAAHPFLETHDLLGGLWDAGDGHVDPSSVTNAMAREARARGVAIRRNSPVTGIAQRDSGRWELETPAGTVSAEIFVNAAGYRAGEIAAMVGHPIPIVSMEHQYLVTEDVPALVAHSGEVPMIRDPEPSASYYMRQERKGFVIGPYEHDGRPWSVEGVPPDFGQELLPPDLDRIETHLADALARVPVAAEAGIRTIINGPITYTPDGLPLIGPVAGIDNYLLNCGSSFGIVQGGGSGRVCAEWILDRHPSLNMWELDPRRFGPHATREWTAKKCKELYDNEYAIGFPHEFGMRPAGRPARLTPAHERLTRAGAVFTATYGWERTAWFADGQERRETHSFRRSNAHSAIACEAKAVRERAGLLDLSGFAKFEATGPGAEEYLNGIGANRMPGRIGGIVLTHALTRDGGVLSEFSVTRLGPERFYLVSAAAAEAHDHDILRARLPHDGSVRLENVTTRYGCLVLAGPRARDILGLLTRADLSSATFPWLSAREIEVGPARVRALRVNYVGELGWELHAPVETVALLYDRLLDAGAPFGLIPFGLRAMDSLRLEKMYRGWRTDLTTEYSLIEAGMERFVRCDKNADFIGREALREQAGNGAPHRLVCLEVAADDADAIATEPVTDGNGRLIGAVTSGGFGHATDKSLALAYLHSAHVIEGAAVAVDILGARRPSVVRLDPVYDPENERLRA